MTAANLISEAQAVPSYDRGERAMLAERAPRAAAFATLILDTCAPFLSVAQRDLHVLDVGCGYGLTSVELARRCARVVGIEPSGPLYQYAARLGASLDLANVEFRQASIYDFEERGRYDLVVLDNVLEHLANPSLALRLVTQCVKPKGAVFILVPNKLWPVEVHYRLPFLAYLPLRLANLYLRATGRGDDFTDASYAPTYFSIKRLLRSQPDLSSRFVLPSDVALATDGWRASYALGAAAIRRFPCLWAVSKVFLIVGVKA